MRSVLSLLVLALLAEPLVAQEPVRADTMAPAVRSDTSVPRVRGDSLRPRAPISPTGAFLRSLVLPGWGQSRLNRNITGGFFIVFEAVAVTMVWKTQWQLEFARARNLYVESRIQEREDWIVLLVFNHVMAAAEAYVSAHLYDFPAALRFQALPRSRHGFVISVPLGAGR